MKFSATYLDRKNKRHRITVDVKSAYKVKKAIYAAVGYKCALVGEPLICDDQSAPVGIVAFEGGRGIVQGAHVRTEFGRFDAAT